MTKPVFIMDKYLTSLFPVWALLLSGIAWFAPGPFVAMKSAILPLLAVIMLGMGLTLTAADFRRVLQQPRLILLGVTLQFLIMPLAAYVVSILLELPLPLLSGMILVGASAGGTASNVICYLARGDVALSISLTLCSTLLAVVATPLLTWLYLGERIPVPVWDMLLSVSKIIIAPVVVGVLLNRFFSARLKPIQPIFPLIAVLAIILIIAIIVALNVSRLREVSVLILFAVIAHNTIGLLGGYWLPRWLGYGPRVCRTLAIEVGMQNSGLSVALAILHFSALAAVPGAIFSIWHNLSGSLLAAIWAGNDNKHKENGQESAKF